MRYSGEIATPKVGTCGTRQTVTFRNWLFDFTPMRGPTPGRAGEIAAAVPMPTPTLSAEDTPLKG